MEFSTASTPDVYKQPHKNEALWDMNKFRMHEVSDITK